MMRAPIGVGEMLADKYRIERVIGEGGMGVVVAATHVQLEQLVAIKFLLAEAMQKPELVARFAREARTLAKLTSEHVGRVIDVGTTASGAPYMVMEYLEGRDLEAELVARGALPVEEAADYLLQAAEAIAEAHAAGIVHRDLKPANLFLAKRAPAGVTVKVLDFGISKSKSADLREAGLTRTSALMGSPLYMSPEQLERRPDVDARSDLWALGVILYELVSGRMPFDADTIPELVTAVLHSAPTPLEQTRAELPAGLSQVVDRCLARDPAARYADVAELARALAPFGSPRAARSVERIEELLHKPSSGASPAADPMSSTARISVSRLGEPMTTAQVRSAELAATAPSFAADGQGRKPAVVASKPAGRRGTWTAIAIAAAAVVVTVAAMRAHGHATSDDQLVAQASAPQPSLPPSPSAPGPPEPPPSEPVAPVPSAAPTTIASAPVPVPPVASSASPDRPGHSRHTHGSGAAAAASPTTPSASKEPWQVQLK